MHAQANLRSQARANVFLSATVISESVSHPARVRNLSSRGAFVDGGSLPSAGSKIRLVRGRLGVDGQVAWSAAGHAGLRFDREIDVASWVKRTDHLGQQRVDELLAAVRRREAPAAGAFEPSLAWVSAELNAVCERLATSAGLTVELGEELMRLDALATIIAQVAARR